MAFDVGQLEVAGHKLPSWALPVGAGAALGLLVLMRRGSSSGAAALPTAPIPVTGQDGGSASTPTDLSPITDALTALQNAQNDSAAQLLQQEQGFEQQQQASQQSFFAQLLASLKTPVGTEPNPTPAPSPSPSPSPPPSPSPNPVAAAFRFVLPSVYRNTSNFFNQWGFGGSALGAGRPAMQGITAGTVLGDLGGIVFPVNYDPHHDTARAAGLPYSGASLVLSRTYDIAAQNGQLGNRQYVQDVLYTQLARLKADLLARGLPITSAGFDLSSIPAYYPTSYAPGKVDVRH